MELANAMADSPHPIAAAKGDVMISRLIDVATAANPKPKAN
jgi:hypothetical protein